MGWGCARASDGVQCAWMMDISSGSENTLPLASYVTINKVPKVVHEGASVSVNEKTRPASQGGGMIEVLCIGTCMLSIQW